MDNFNESLSEGQEGTVDLQNETQQTGNTPVEPVNAGAETTTPIQEVKPTQTPEQNAQFATIRRESEQRAKDTVIAEMGYEWNGQPITTYAQYQNALNEQRLQQEAQTRGIDPTLYTEINGMKDELTSLKREKTLMAQDNMLSNDPKVGAIYKEWKNDVVDVANQYNIDYDTAFTILTRERISDLMSKQAVQAEQAAIKGLQFNAQTTPGALGGAQVDHRADVKNMSSADFEKLINGIKRGEITSI